MTANDILSKLILKNISISQALMLTKFNCLNVISEESMTWIDQEISGYDNSLQIPDYRLLTCDLYIEVLDAFDNLTVKRLETTYISAYLQKGGYEKSSPDKMHVSQGIESLEALSKNESGNIKMYLDEGLKNQILKWYIFPKYSRFGRIYQESNIAYVMNLLTNVKSKLIKILQGVSSIESNVIIREDNQLLSSKIQLFISYSWEDEQHQSWVHSFANKLGKYFDVAIDVHQSLGIDINQFMENMVSNSDRVLLILTPIYKHKADARENGVGYESVLISEELYRNQSSNKFIPIIRKGTMVTSYPKYIGNRLGLDMTDDNQFDTNFQRLVDDIISSKKKK